MWYPTNFLMGMFTTQSWKGHEAIVVLQKKTITLKDNAESISTTENLPFRTPGVLDSKLQEAAPSVP